MWPDWIGHDLDQTLRGRAPRSTGPGHVLRDRVGTSGRLPARHDRVPASGVRDHRSRLPPHRGRPEALGDRDHDRGRPLRSRQDHPPPRQLTGATTTGLPHGRDDPQPAGHGARGPLPQRRPAARRRRERDRRPDAARGRAQQVADRHDDDERVRRPSAPLRYRDRARGRRRDRGGRQPDPRGQPGHDLGEPRRQVRAASVRRPRRIRSIRSRASGSDHGRVRPARALRRSVHRQPRVRRRAPRFRGIADRPRRGTTSRPSAAPGRTSRASWWLSAKAPTPRPSTSA